MIKHLVNQTLVLTRASMKARYRKSFAGLFWVILYPIILFLVQLFVFKNILKIGSEHYEFYLLSAYLPWLFVTQTLTMATPQLIAQSSLLKSVQLNPMLIILALSLDNFINFLLAFVIILIGLNFAGVYSSFSPFLLFPVFLLVYIAVSSLGFIFSIINVFFRDLQFILQFVLMLFYFITPIFYQPQMYPDKWQWILRVNPFYIFIEPIIFIMKNKPMFEIIASALKLLFMTIIFILTARFYWKKIKNEFYLNI